MRETNRTSHNCREHVEEMRVLNKRRILYCFSISLHICAITLTWSTFRHLQSRANNTNADNETEDQGYKTDSTLLRAKAPVCHIGFLKVRKAGSTTMQNLLFRFAIRHNLTILLPRKHSHLLRKQQAVTLQTNNHYDIFACHSFGNMEIFKLLPEDAVKIAIIRDPLERVISAAYYRRDIWHDGYLTRIPRDQFIENLLMFPEKYDNETFSETRNTMGEDFGFKNILKNSTDKKVIESVVNSLKREYISVLVLDRFYESLVLLKRKFNWSLQDILFFETNTNKHELVELTEALKSNFRETSFLDYAIYETFYKILEDEIKVQEPDFQEEVTHFIDINSNMKEFCLKAGDKSNTLEVPDSKWNQRFNIEREECNFMKMNESTFIDYLRDRHSRMHF